MIPAADCDGGKEDLGEGGGAGGEGGDGAAVHVVTGVGDQEIESKTNTANDDETPDGTSLIPSNSHDIWLETVDFLKTVPSHILPSVEAGISTKWREKLTHYWNPNYCIFISLTQVSRAY